MTPFSGLCVYTASIMHLFLAAFPLMNLSNSTSARECASQSIAMLEEFRGVWRVGEGWCGVIEVARGMYKRVAEEPEAFFGKGREDFGGLERAFNNASWKMGNGEALSDADATAAPTVGSTPQGSSREIIPSTSTTIPTVDNRIPTYGTMQLQYNTNPWDTNPNLSNSNTYTGIPSATFDLLQNFDSESWRVWSFWDDPNLVPFGDSSFNSNLDFGFDPSFDDSRQ
jgi:hypothetical protein